MVPKGFLQSMDRFKKIDGNNFGGCLRQIQAIDQNIILEWRIPNNSASPAIIEYHNDGKGYHIYISENEI